MPAMKPQIVAEYWTFVWVAAYFGAQTSKYGFLHALVSTLLILLLAWLFWRAFLRT